MNYGDWISTANFWYYLMQEYLIIYVTKSLQSFKYGFGNLHIKKL